MNNLKIFENAEFGKIRTMEQNGEPWFVGKDVADILGYKNGSRDINSHVDEEDRLKYQISTAGQMREQTFINESGLYSLVLSSKLPTAKIFKRWITKEVIPAIRKHGGYLTPEKTEELLRNPDLLIQMLTDLKIERAKRAEAEQQLKAAEPKVIFADAVSASDTTILIGDIWLKVPQKQAIQYDFLKILLLF